MQDREAGAASEFLNMIKSPLCKKQSGDLF